MPSLVRDAVTINVQSRGLVPQVVLEPFHTLIEVLQVGLLFGMMCKKFLMRPMSRHLMFLDTSRHRVMDVFPSRALPPERGAHCSVVRWFLQRPDLSPRLGHCVLRVVNLGP